MNLLLHNKLGVNREIVIVVSGSVYALSDS